MLEWHNKPDMTPEQAELFDVISRAVNSIVYRWSIFEQLYGSQEKVDLLNKSGSNVFQLFQRLIIDDVMLALCRLTDPGRSMGRENASIRNLLAKVRGALPVNITSQIDVELKELDDHLQSHIRVLKNKTISHADLEHTLDAALLPRPTYDDIDRSIVLVKSILNKISSTLLGYTSPFHIIMPFGADGNKLLKVLAKAHGVTGED